VSEPIGLLIVDDHPVVRDGLSGMFSAAAEFTVLGQASDGAEAVRLAEALRPDVILMDLRMPGLDGVGAIVELARRGVAARVLVLTTYDTDSDVLAAIEAGATGYLLKDAPRAELVRAVRAAANGEAVLAPSVAARLMSRVRNVTEPLSSRELEVLALVAAGNTNREAAAGLFISEATVKTHLLHIYEKLGVSDRAAAVAEAFNRGLLTPGRLGPAAPDNRATPRTSCSGRHRRAAPTTASRSPLRGQSAASSSPLAFLLSTQPCIQASWNQRPNSCPAYTTQPTPISHDCTIRTVPSAP
jgi:DNA-binding NarL/FixJ family response regulator